MIVLDASAVLELLRATATGERIRRRLQDAGETLCAPYLMDVEVAQALRRFERIGSLSAMRGAEALADLADLPLTRFPHEHLLGRIWELRHNVTACDAAYIALAEALHATLVTCDGKVASARGRGLQVELFSVKE